ncbi:MAG: hypothetical protein WA354_14565 [Terracidiphilus sp.]
MGTVEGVLGASIHGVGTWHADWGWGLLVIFLTVIIHISGLGIMHERAAQTLSRVRNKRHSGVRFVLVLGAVSMLTTALHVIEIIIWAICFLLLNALPDAGSAMLYSLNAMTSYGHESLFLEPRWQLLGATEALNGWLLFGLTTAFLFSMFQRALQTVERQIPNDQ